MHWAVHVYSAGTVTRGLRPIAFLSFFWEWGLGGWAAATLLMSPVPPGLPLKHPTPSKPLVTGEGTVQ